MSTKRTSISRRTLLRGAGGVAIGLPFLNAMGCTGRVVGPGQAGADAGVGGGADAGVGGGGGEDVPPGGFPTRFLVFFTPEGALDDWRPTGGERDFVLSPHHADLIPFRDRLVVLGGVDQTVTQLDGQGGDLHTRGMGAQLSGAKALDAATGSAFGGGRTIDQIIAEAITPDGMRRSLELGVQVNASSPWTRLNYRGPNDPMPAQDDPRKTFDAVFAAVDPDAEARLRRRRLVVDAVLDDYHALEARLGAEDRQRLDRHLQSLYEIESRLGGAGPGGAACVAPSLDGRDLTDYRAVGELQTELAVMALACDTTRVATLQWSRSNNYHLHPWLGGLNATADHHDIVHNHWASPENASIYRFHVSRFAALLARLAEIPEGDGASLLDHTCVLWTTDMSRGRHDHRDMPYVLAGGANGRLETGRFLTYGGVPHNQLLVSLLNLYGVAATSIGEPSLGSGPLPGFLAG